MRRVDYQTLITILTTQSSPNCVVSHTILEVPCFWAILIAIRTTCSFCRICSLYLIQMSNINITVWFSWFISLLLVDTSYESRRKMTDVCSVIRQWWNWVRRILLKRVNITSCYTIIILVIVVNNISSCLNIKLFNPFLRNDYVLRIW